MELNAHNLQKVGQFLDASEIPVTSRAIRYIVDDTYYCVDEDGWWYFDNEPESMGWTKCNPPVGPQEEL